MGEGFMSILGQASGGGGIGNGGGGYKSSAGGDATFGSFSSSSPFVVGRGASAGSGEGSGSNLMLYVIAGITVLSFVMLLFRK